MSVRWLQIAYASSLDTPGVIARDVRTASCVLDAICGHDARDSTSLAAEAPATHHSLTGDLNGLTVGIPQEYCVRELGDAALNAWQTAIDYLKAAGAVLSPCSSAHPRCHLCVLYHCQCRGGVESLALRWVRYGPPMPLQQTFIDAVRVPWREVWR